MFRTIRREANRTGLSGAAALFSVCLGLGACQVAENNPASGVKVAGANAQVDTEQAYAPTVYVRMSSTMIGGGSGPEIDNVGTFLTVDSIPSYNVLLVPLAGKFEHTFDSSIAYLPVFASINISIYTSDAAGTAVQLRNLKMDKKGAFTFDGDQGAEVKMMFVGANFVRNPAVSFPSALTMAGITPDLIESKARSLIVPNQMTVNGVDLANEATSYMFLLISKRLLNAPAARLVDAEDRPTESELSQSGALKIVGFGTVHDTAKAGAAADQPNTRRNVADVRLLNDTPLHKFLLGSRVAQKLWETSGGICDDLDIGSSVYTKSGDFVGFVARSTSVSGGYKGFVKCGAVANSNDQASLVVSVASDQIAALRTLANQ